MWERFLHRGYDAKLKKMFVVDEMDFTRETGYITGFWGHITESDDYNGWKMRYGGQVGKKYYDKERFHFMQCLGIRDKNGTLIFEGDILKRQIFRKTVIGEVVWNDMGGTGFMLKVSNPDSISFYSIGRGQFDDDTGDKNNDEIIGNIHETPALLL